MRKPQKFSGNHSRFGPSLVARYFRSRCVDLATAKALGAWRHSPQSAAPHPKEKRPPTRGGLRDSKSPIPPKKNGLTTGQSFRQNTVQARAIKWLPCVSHSLCLTGNRPWSALPVTPASVQFLDRPRRREAAGQTCTRLYSSYDRGVIRGRIIFCIASAFRRTPP